MKKIAYLIMTVLLFLSGISSLHAQGIEGKEFWLTFGRNRASSYVNMNLQIRIIGGAAPANGTIYFTHLKTYVSFNVAARQVYVCNLDTTQKQATLNTTMGVTDFSIHITSNNPITVYAMNQTVTSADATNILPVTSLGIDYHHISYAPISSNFDAYAIIGIEDNTNLSHNGAPVVTLKKGEVYYRTSATDMTGAHIIANKPVAFFSVNQNANIPQGFGYNDCLMQQMLPVPEWGRSFFAPVSHLGRDIVRIVASQNNTTITQIGGSILFPDGGQTSLTSLQAGQFVELEISLAAKGCYIYANKPVGVCTYLTGGKYNEQPSTERSSDPSQCWLLAMDQRTNEALITPFTPTGSTRLRKHSALVVTPTAAKNNTQVAIGGAPATGLSGGSWRDNTASGMSFYIIDSLISTDVHRFTNQKGIIVMCYGTGLDESYYFNAYATFYEPDATFFANDIHYENMPPYVFCVQDIEFRAVIKDKHPGPGWLKWYIDGAEEVGARDSLIWSKNFDTGKYEIEMQVSFANENKDTLKSILNIGVPISAYALPTVGGGVIGDGCYKEGELVNLIATANIGYDFVNWTENDTVISTGTSYMFTVEEPRTFVANFKGQLHNIVVLANPAKGGTVSDNIENIPYGTDTSVLAVPYIGYSFINWTKGDDVVHSMAFYPFAITESCTLVANFKEASYNITVVANPTEGGTVSGGVNNIPHGASVTVSATAKPGYSFTNWTKNGVQVSTGNPYLFSATESCTLTANFGKMRYTVKVDVNDTIYGCATGAGVYDAFDEVRVEAFVKKCYRLINWTIDDKEVSTKNPYIFSITEDVNLVAHISAIDFSKYTSILWNNTIILNVKQLVEEGLEVTGCKWFKNGIEEETHTTNEFSYSAGPNITNLLEPAPTYYMFKLITANFDTLCSTEKMFTGSDLPSGSKTDHLLVYPNPVSSGNSFIVEGVSKDSPIDVYNQYGVCVSSAVATGNTVMLTLHLPAGVYFIRADNKEGKVVIIK